MANDGLLRPRTRPCPTCPYRRDVPSGVWAASEYAKLPQYDGDTTAQAEAQAFAPFLCHQMTGHLCAGWVACHDMSESLAVRLHHRKLDMRAVLDYVSPVPLFRSGAEAAAHGMRDMASPGKAAKAAALKLLRLQAANRKKGQPDE